MEAIFAVVFFSQHTSNYIGVLQNIELLYPDAKQILSYNGFSVQAQDRYMLQIAVDQRGGWTVNCWRYKFFFQIRV